ncbi:hypothetical protein [Tuberibacillus sp. Marseille-P3662]|uniref:hypothetical protein n=1 Tax=Tuberibacillus sp. Marseille-P3662 TaxID=1965358 RepID=UPI000A1CB696|nr:hypothetical protein [Tuberibacillus sp. Marseille-P3662]
MILLDPIAVAITEQVGSVVVIFIFVGTVASVILAILAFSNQTEKKNIAMIALPITLINIAVIGFFLWFGANVAS